MSDATKTIEGRTGPWEIVLGLEVHAQVASKSKLFSGAAVGFGASIRFRPRTAFGYTRTRFA